MPKDPRARLFYDDPNKAIIIAFTNKRTEASYPVGFTKQYGGYIVAGKFFEKIGLKLENYTGRYEYRIMKAEEVGIPDIKGKVFVLHLHKPFSKDSKIISEDNK